MNDKQRSSNDEPNRDPRSANERQDAEQTARLLELQPIEALSKDDQATAELGRLLRDAAQADLPESNVDLREQLLAEMGSGSAVESDQVTLGAKKMTSSEVTSSKATSSEVSSRSTGRRFWIAAAASGLLLVGGTIAYNSDFVGTLSNVALLEDQEQPNVEAIESDLVSPSSKPELPEVVFRLETRTRQVPITRTATETKTGPGTPVIKYHDETKQIKQADGSIKTETVKVPHTEFVRPDYTESHTFTENVLQSYQVQVPYTADGKPIEKSDYGKYGLGSDGGMRGGQGLENEDRLSLELDSGFEEELESSAVVDLPDSSLTEMSKIPDADNNGRKDALGPSRIASTVLLTDGREQLDGGSESGQQGLQGEQGQEGQGQQGGQGQEGGQGSESETASWSALKERRRKFNLLTPSVNEPIAKPAELKDRFAGFAQKKANVAKDEYGNLTVAGDPNNVARIKEEINRLSKEAKSGQSGESILASSGNELSGRSSPEDLSRPVEFLSGGEIPAESSFRGMVAREGTAVLGPLKAADERFNLAGERDEDRRIQGFLGRNEGKDKENYFERGGEQYEPIFENAFIAAKGPTAISTFSIDVDTASYANMRRMLNSGRRPPPNSIRLEELVNYFQYDYAQPTGEHPFSVNMELADCPWQPGQQLLRVGLRGKDIHVAERPATNVVFLIDVSGSMSSNDKLPLLKSGFQMMSRQLGENDRVSIVTYAGNAGVALDPPTALKPAQSIQRSSNCLLAVRLTVVLVLSWLTSWLRKTSSRAASTE